VQPVAAGGDPVIAQSFKHLLSWYLRPLQVR
jgi:hypothetical protein